MGKEREEYILRGKEKEFFCKIKYSSKINNSMFTVMLILKIYLFLRRFYWCVY